MPGMAIKTIHGVKIILLTEQSSVYKHNYKNTIDFISQIYYNIVSAGFEKINVYGVVHLARSIKCS